MIEKLIFTKDGIETIINYPADYEVAAALITKESWDNDHPDDLAILEIVEKKEYEVKNEKTI